MIVCPLCDGEVDRLAGIPWGEHPNTLQPLMPYVCGWCGSLLICELAKLRLIVPDAGHLAIMREANPALWRAIEAVQARVRAAPGRRRPRNSPATS